MLCIQSMSFAAFAVFLAAPLMSQQVPLPAAASILSGVILDSNNQPVVGAQLILAPSSKQPGQQPASSATTNTDKGGAFSASGLGPGTYTVCALDPSDQLLNPCEWTTSAPTITVAAAASLAPLSLKLVAGALLNISVSDPQGLVPTHFQNPNAALGTAAGATLAAGSVKDFQITVWSKDGNYHMVRYVSTTGTTHMFRLLIPAGVTLKLDVRAMGMQVTDGTGARVDGVKGLTVQATSIAQPVSLSYNVGPVK
jgi:hypothetical protein